MKQVIIIAACLSVLPAFAVNKCIVNGKTVYQDAPCHGGGTAIDARPNGAFGEAVPATPSRRSQSRGDDVPVNHQAVLNGMATGKPAVGMTENQLNIAMGKPNRVNSSDYGGRQSQQLIYERDGATYYVYVREGVVTSVQASEGYPQRRSQKKCPSALEIRNLETSASSITISESERRDLREKVWRARSCL